MRRRRTRPIGHGRRGGARSREPQPIGGSTGRTLDVAGNYRLKQRKQRPSLTDSDKKQLTRIRAWGKTQTPKVRFSVKWETPLERVAVVQARRKGVLLTVRLRGQWAGNLRDMARKAMGLR